VQKAQAVHEHQPQWANGALDEHQSSQRSLSHTPFTGRVDVVKLRTNRVRLACMCLCGSTRPRVFPSRFRNRHAIDTAQNQKHTLRVSAQHRTPHARTRTHNGTGSNPRKDPSIKSSISVKSHCVLSYKAVLQPPRRLDRLLDGASVHMTARVLLRVGKSHKSRTLA